MTFLEPASKFYSRFERPISSLSLLSGFIFDALTLKRVDTLWENFWILIHLLIICVFIILIHANESGEGDEKNPSKAHFWYVNILQFFFGGILSAFLVFYFRSADILVTWPFILLLIAAFVANESLKRHYVRLSFQISLFFLSVYSFAIFFIPVILHQIGTYIFLLSGLVSLVFISIFVSVLFYFLKDRFTESKRLVVFLVLGIFATVNILYFTNLIPPIPLSLKSGGIYHSVQKNDTGNYDVTSEPRSWRDYLNIYQDFTQTPTDPVYAFSAVFSPRDLNITIVHEWQHYDEVKKKWLTNATIRLPVVGGRDGGFRTYSMLTNLTPGKWRVNIKTTENKVIGRLRFRIVDSNTLPALVDEIVK
ncbi:MAG: DUF2914 domain-containing protein [Patescibacteria group bacterium]|nr:DUF2914 domain-containing protein [Patescibacteria group bacterium]